MGQQASNPLVNNDKQVTTEAIFQPEPQMSIEERLKSGYRMSSAQRQNTKHQNNNQQLSLYEITEHQPSEAYIKKQMISLLPIQRINYKEYYQNNLPLYLGTGIKGWPYYQQIDLFIRRTIRKTAKMQEYQTLICSPVRLYLYMLKNLIKSKASIRIQIQKCDKNFVFKGKNDKQTMMWFERLTKVTNQSLGRKYNLTYLATYNRFWRKDYFSQKQFKENAQSGDIILMRGKNTGAALQRAITFQQFDHIALVLKNMRHQVLLFEANGGVGVGIVPWHKLISKKWFNKQQLMVYRKLNIARTEEFNQQIQDFVERNVGRKYKFSVKKYFMNRDSKQRDRGSYFCSSLVAKIYKNLQLLDQKVSATQYLPSSFSQKNQIKLRDDGKYGPASLGRQKIIVFQQHFFNQTK